MTDYCIPYIYWAQFFFWDMICSLSNRHFPTLDLQYTYLLKAYYVYLSYMRNNCICIQSCKKFVEHNKLSLNLYNYHNYHHLSFCYMSECYIILVGYICTSPTKKKQITCIQFSVDIRSINSTMQVYQLIVCALSMLAWDAFGQLWQVCVFF